MEQDRIHRRELKFNSCKNKEHRRRPMGNLQEEHTANLRTEVRVDLAFRRRKVQVAVQDQASGAEKSLYRQPQLEVQEVLKPRVKKGGAGKD